MIQPIQIVQLSKTQPTFGILKEHKKTPYGDYTRGVYKNYKVEIYDAKKYDQKLYYVSDNKLLHWLKTKLIYIQDGVKKVVKSSSSR